MLRSVVTLLLMAASVASTAVAQVADWHALEARQSFYGYLTASNPNNSSPVSLIAGEPVVVRAFAPGPVEFTIRSPSAFTIDPNSITQLGGENVQFFLAVSPGPFLLPYSEIGFHSVYRFTPTESGIYDLRLTRTTGQDSIVALFVEVKSSLTASLIVPKEYVRLGENVSIGLAVLSNGAPAPLVNSAVATVIAPNGAVSSVMLLDNGNAADGASADGLHSGSFTTTQAGPYRISATALAVQAGLTVVREAGDLVNVRNNEAAFLSAEFSQTLVDTNSDGRWEALRLEIPVEVSVAGRFRLKVQLRAPDLGNAYNILGLGEFQLLPGNQALTATVASSQLVDRNISITSYHINHASLLFLSSDEGWIEVDQLAGLWMPALASDISAMDRPAIWISQFAWGTHANAPSPQDNVLEVVPVIWVRQSGVYTYEMSLWQACGGRIYTRRGSFSLLADQANSPDIVLDGQAIGVGALLGAEGPFRVTLQVLGLGAQARRDLPEAISFVLSDGGAFADCNGNVEHDLCDIGAKLSTDRNGNLIPDECEPDCNGNGLPDDWELAEGGAPDCNSNFIVDACEPDCDLDGTPDACEPGTDCNANGILDYCDRDCDGDAWVDACETDLHYISSTRTLACPALNCPSPSATLNNVPMAYGPATLSFTNGYGDFNSETEYLTILLDGQAIGTIFGPGGVDCGSMAEQLVVPEEMIAPLVADGVLVVEATAPVGVNPAQCSQGWRVDVRVSYRQNRSFPPVCLRGDMNCNGVVNTGDLGPFVLAITNPTSYVRQFFRCNIMNGDMNDNGVVNVADINLFVDLLTGP